MTKPLEGIRVLSFVHVLAGPVSTYLLADLGAEVIEIEEPTGASRRLPPDVPAVPGKPDEPWNRSTGTTRRSKLSFVLDVAKPSGRDVFLELVRKCDIMIENFSPRVLVNLRLNYDELIKVKPDIIQVSISAFGKTGPYRDRTAYGPGLDAMSGIAHLTGYADRGPGKPGPVLNDFNSGILAAFSALAALRHRRRTGEGQYVEVSMLEAEVHSIADALIALQFTHREPTRVGNAHPSAAPHNVYPCEGEDRWIAIACSNDAEFRALTVAMGRPDLSEDSRFADAVHRKQNEDILDGEVARWTRSQQNVQAQELLQRHGVPAGAVLDVKEVIWNEHSQARALYQPASNDEIGEALYMRGPWKFRGTPSPITSGPPMFGEHNDFVLRDLLGLSEERIAELERDRIVTQIPSSDGWW